MSVFPTPKTIQISLFTKRFCALKTGIFFQKWFAKNDGKMRNLWDRQRTQN